MMTQIQKFGWKTDPFDGLKIMKNDFNYFFNADKDLQTLKAKIEYLEVTVDFLKRCMDNITWRHQTIKNTIEWRKFMAIMLDALITVLLITSLMLGVAVIVL